MGMETKTNEATSVQGPNGKEHLNLNDLNKTQVLLLVLFVAFVTSIASSIVTVTLLDQAPPAITQTINRVVERTVQVAVPGKPVIERVERVREVPVIVTEEDLIADAVKGTAPAIVFISDAIGVAASSTPLATTTPLTSHALGIGFVVSKDGLIVSSGTGYDAGAVYTIRGWSGSVAKEWQAKVEKTDLPTGYVLLHITNMGKGDTLSSLSFAASDPAAGKTALAVGSSRNAASVLVGTIASYDTKPVATLITTLVSGKEQVGAPILDTKGSVIGIVGEDGTSLPIDPLLQYLNKASVEKESSGSATSTIDKKTVQ